MPLCRYAVPSALDWIGTSNPTAPAATPKEESDVLKCFSSPSLYPVELPPMAGAGAERIGP